MEWCARLQYVNIIKKHIHLSEKCILSSTDSRQYNVVGGLATTRVERRGEDRGEEGARRDTDDW